MSKSLTKKNTVALKELRENMEEYIKRVDEGESFTVFRRSDPIFRLSPVDSEDIWETVVDFTQIDKRGVSASDILGALRTFHESHRQKGGIHNRF